MLDLLIPQSTHFVRSQLPLQGSLIKPSDSSLCSQPAPNRSPSPLSLRDISPHRGESPFTREPDKTASKSRYYKKTTQLRKTKTTQKNRAPIKVPCKSVLLTLFNAFLLCPCPFSQRSLLRFIVSLLCFQRPLLRFTVHLLCFFSALYCVFCRVFAIFSLVGVFGISAVVFCIFPRFFGRRVKAHFTALHRCFSKPIGALSEL